MPSDGVVPCYHIVGTRKISSVEGVLVGITMRHHFHKGSRLPEHCYWLNLRSGVIKDVAYSEGVLSTSLVARNQVRARGAGFLRTITLIGIPNVRWQGLRVRR